MFGTAALLDIIYPPECAGCREITDAPHGLCPGCWADTSFITGPVCRQCGVPVVTALPGQEIFCEGCVSHPPAWARGRAAILYAGTGRDVILKFKGSDRLDLAPVLAGWMARAGAELLAGADLIAPVPQHWTRMLRRRFNQAAELARQPALASHAPVIPDLLLRRKPTAHQRGHDREARHRNVAGAFVAHPRRAKRMAGRSVLLVDDVMTSGATLSAAAEACKSAGAARVDVLVVARVAREGFAPI